MKRLLITGLTVLLVGAGLLVSHAFEQSRTYDRSIEAVWDEAVKATRDVDFVLVDSDRSKHELTMRTKSKLSAKRGLHMYLNLVETSAGTRVIVKPADPAKVKKTAKHITQYLQALDKRLD
jgi:DNA polymerase III alpha subunit (gram-positive type)